MTTWAEKMKLLECRCGHPNTIHAGGIGTCTMHGCLCGEFREAMPGFVNEEKTEFQKVKEIMGS